MEMHEIAYEVCNLSVHLEAVSLSPSKLSTKKKAAQVGLPQHLALFASLIYNP